MTKLKNLADLDFSPLLLNSEEISSGLTFAFWDHYLRSVWSVFALTALGHLPPAVRGRLGQRWQKDNGQNFWASLAHFVPDYKEKILAAALAVKSRLLTDYLAQRILVESSPSRKEKLRSLYRLAGGQNWAELQDGLSQLVKAERSG